MSRTLPKVNRCQNCGAKTGGNFCPQCGQDCREHRVSLRALLGDLWAEIFTFDSRIFRSLVPLLIKPGELTLEYIRGRRVRYIPPLRLFLFIIILFFFSLAFRVNPLLSDAEAPAAPADSAAASEPILPASSDSSGVSAVDPAIPSGFPARPDGASSVPEGDANGLEASATEPDQLPKWSEGRWTFMGKDVTDSRSQIFRIAMKLGPKIVFLLLPVFAALLALVYIRKRRLFIEHLVFALHYHALLFLLFTIAALSGQALVWFLSPAAGGIYLYFALKRVYGQGWWKTLAKHFLLTGAYNFTFLVFFIITMGSSAWLLDLSGRHPWLLGWFG